MRATVVPLVKAPDFGLAATPTKPPTTDHGSCRYRRLAIGLFTLVAIGATAPAQSLRERLAGAKEKLERAAERGREVVGDARQNWEQRAHACLECGKTIHVGTTCMTCTAKKGAQQAQQTVEATRQAWKQTAPARARAVDAVRDAASDLKRGAIEAGTRLRAEAPRVRDGMIAAAHWADQRARECEVHLRRARDVYGPKVAAAIRDPDVLRQVLTTIGELHDIHERIQGARLEGTLKAVRVVASIPLAGANGRTTLGDEAREYMLQKMPYLQGTDLAEDPAVPIAHLLAGEKGYFVEEMKVVPVHGERLSVRDAILRSSRLDPETTIQCIHLVGVANQAHRALTTGEGMEEAVLSLGKELEILTRK